MTAKNQDPEQIARDKIDKMLIEAGWDVQDKTKIDFTQKQGQAVREYQTEAGEADYALFVDRTAKGIIEAKREEAAQNITVVEEQSSGYAKSKLKFVNNDEPLPFIYESTGAITRFTDLRDPKPRSREVFSFHQPQTLLDWSKEAKSIRARLQDLPDLPHEGLRDCQITAIENLEKSFKEDRPRALVQMATGSGKTFTAITSVYRLLKYAKAKRILFLVDTKNLGEQAEQEFLKYVPNDDNRKFTELYNVRRLGSSYVPKDAQVCISTIQRMYSILKGEDLDEATEQENPAERFLKRKEPLPVAYNEKVPPEFFDVIIIDECHRSIYNLWRQVLDYFDSYLVGLTATPDNRTYGFFNKNVVSEYDHEKAVADGVNVGNEIYIIETERTNKGGTIAANQQVLKREKLTRKKRWEMQDEDETYAASQLDKKIVLPDQIRTVIRTFKEKLPDIFPNRSEVPKTLIFAKTDSHADDIIQIVREEFGERNDFCKKITYQATEDPKSVLSQFRNDYYPRIAVTVDMIATGTDVKPLECLLFMRDVKSRNYFEQMKGRGTRTLDHDALKKVTPSANTAKTHYVIVDAIGVTKSLKTASQPLITKPTVPLKDLAMGVMMGASDEDTVSSLAGRLSRLNKQLNDKDIEHIKQETGGIDLTDITKGLLSAIDPDNVTVKAKSYTPEGTDEPDDKAKEKAQADLVKDASAMFTGQFIELIDSIRRDKEQTVLTDALDNVTRAEWDGDAKENAQNMVQNFEAYLEENKDEIEALSIYYNEPFRRKDVTFQMIKDVLEKLKSDKPALMPARVWKAYAVLDDVNGEHPTKDLTALVSLIRRACGIDSKISRHSATVRKNFQDWIMKHHSGSGAKFNQQQMEWLHMIRDHIMSSFHIDKDDLEYEPFDRNGGLGRMHQLFGENMDTLLNELNEALAA
jgi:type I restriction enzyme R subunit